MTYPFGRSMGSSRCCHRILRHAVGCLFVCLSIINPQQHPTVSAFHSIHPFSKLNFYIASSSTSSTSRLFVFDFIKQRSQEGLNQLSNLAEATAKGQLGQGLQEAAAYTSQTNQAFSQGLAKSRNRFLNNLDGFFLNNLGLTSQFASGSVSQEDLLAELEDVLLMADLGTATAQDIVKEVRELCISKDLEEKQQPGKSKASFQLDRDDLMSIMRGKLIEALTINKPSDDDTLLLSTDDIQNLQQYRERTSKLPTVWFIMGANGMGKTTTIGKLAHRLRTTSTTGSSSSSKDGICSSETQVSVLEAVSSADDTTAANTTSTTKVLLAACDTFRAGAVEQLQAWADRAQVDLVGPSEQAKSPSAVLFNALDKAIREQYDILLVDTSGRLSSNDALTAELAKMKRVIQKRLSVETDASTGKPILNPLVPQETLLVLDAAQGRMALDSAKVWHEEIGLTGLILTKLDGSARGGSVVAVSRDLNLPVKMIGVGEGIEDLRDVSVVLNDVLKQNSPSLSADQTR
jgi:fused signal recognition particle receptor